LTFKDFDKPHASHSCIGPLLGGTGTTGCRSSHTSPNARADIIANARADTIANV